MKFVPAPGRIAKRAAQRAELPVAERKLALRKAGFHGQQAKHLVAHTVTINQPRPQHHIAAAFPIYRCTARNRCHHTGTKPAGLCYLACM